jgi:hypothetical protein
MAETSSQRTKPNGKPPPPLGWECWLGSAAAAKTLGVSLRTLQTLIEHGHLMSLDAPDGTRRFSQQALEEFERERDLLFGEDTLDEGEDKKASREGIPADAIRATAELLKSAHKQNLELHALVVTGFKAASDAQQKTIDQLQKRNDHFETMFLQFMQQREEMFDHAQEREQTRERFKAVEQRRTEILEQAKVWGTQIVDAWRTKYVAEATAKGAESVPADKMAAVMKLLSSIDPSQLEMLAMMGVFNAEQLACLEQILGRKVGSPAAAPKSSPGVETPNPVATAPGADQSAAADSAKGK